MPIEYDETLFSKSIKNKQTKTGKFEVYKDKTGKYRFRLKSPTGEILVVSEGYRSKTSCINGIERVKKNVPTAKVVDLGCIHKK